MTLDFDEPYEIRRARAWARLQQLNSLPSYAERLGFWIQTFNCMPHSTTYCDGENTPFCLDLKAESVEDLNLYYTTYFDFERARVIQEECIVKKFGFTQMGRYDEQIAFRVKPIDSLKATLNERLSKHPNLSLRNTSLQRQLEDITSIIDACIGDDKRRSIYYTTVRDLRHSLEVGEKYERIPAYEPEDLLRWSPENKLTILAELWDIVHFERYLIEEVTGSTEVQKSLVANHLEMTTQTVSKIYNDSNSRDSKNEAVGLSPKVYITMDAHAPLKKALLPYILDEDSKGSFEMVLAGQTPLKSIAVHCLQTSLLYIFRQLKDRGKMPAESTAIRDWLVQHFLVKVKGKGELRRINPNTAYDALTKNERINLPQDSNLISIDLD